MLPVAASHIRIACPVPLEKRPPCHHTTRCPLLCASHDKREGVIRRQRGLLPSRAAQRVGVGLATTLISAKSKRVTVTVKRTVAAAAVPHQRKRHQGVFVNRDLPNCERRAADSAGQAAE